MPNSNPTSHLSPGTTRHWLRWGLVLLLLLLLLLQGVFDEVVFAQLDNLWQQVLTSLHLDKVAATLQAGIDSKVTRRSLLSGLSYAGLYVGLCLLLLRLLLPQPESWRIVLRLYGGILIAYLLLLGAGKFSSNLTWAYTLSRRLLDFLVSPVPVFALIVLLRGSRFIAPKEARHQSEVS